MTYNPNEHIPFRNLEAVTWKPKRILHIAVDFDGTVVIFDWPKIGTERPQAIKVLKSLKKNGHRIVLWTCRTGSALNDALTWLRERGIQPDGINDHAPDSDIFEMVSKEDLENHKKIHADIYLDDKSWPPFTGWFSFFCWCIEEDYLPPTAWKDLQ